MIIIPEIKLKKLIEGILASIKLNFESATDPQDTLLYFLFNGLKEGHYDYYIEAKNLFLREVTHAKKIQTYLAFNRNPSNVPSIYISLPGEQSENNGIGIDQGYPDYFTLQDGNKQPTYNRMFGAQYNLIITSENVLEVILIYHTLRAVLISTMDTLEMSGLRNIRYTGQDININTELVPPHLFIKSLGISFDYEVDVPRFFMGPIENLADITFTGTAQITT